MRPYVCVSGGARPWVVDDARGWKASATFGEDGALVMEADPAG